MHTYMSLQGGLLVRRGFCSGVCLEGFVRGGFCLSPLLSEYIHYNRKLNITFNFRFHMYMYEFFLKCDVTCSWTPPLSVPNTVAWFFTSNHMSTLKVQLIRGIHPMGK